MQTEEEIEILAEVAFQKAVDESNQDKNWIGYGKGVDGVSKAKWTQIWIKGYLGSQ